MIASLDEFTAVDQLSRAGAVEAVQRHGAALTLASISAAQHEQIAPELMHQGLHMDTENTRELLLRVARLRGMPDD